MQTLICPSCGLEKNKNLFIDNICKACYYKDKAKFSVKIDDIIICKSCGRLKQGFVWKPFAEDSFKGIIESNIKTNFDYRVKSIDINFFRSKLEVDILFSAGKEIFEELLTFSPKYQYCQDCYKKISDYFECEVQIRDFGNNRDVHNEFMKMLNKAAKEELKKGNYGAYLQKFEQVNNGINYYLGSKSLGQAFVREIKEKYDIDKKDSFKLVGILPGGRDKIRTTFLIRKHLDKKKEEVNEYVK